MPLLNCGNSYKLAQYFVFTLAVRMFQLFPRRKRDCVHQKIDADNTNARLTKDTNGNWIYVGTINTHSPSN